MKRTMPTMLVVVLVLGLGPVAISHAAQMGTAFTYQGRVEKGGSAAGGSCDFEFSLWDAPSDGNQLATTQAKAGVSVTDGLFTVKLDFGEQFNGQARWLEMAVCCPSTCSVVTLSPRQELTPAPHALALPGLWTQQNAVSEAPNMIGGYADNEVKEGAVAATISGGGSETDPNRIYDDYGTVGGGGNNRAGSVDADPANAQYATVGGGYNNQAAAAYATIGGGGPASLAAGAIAAASDSAIIPSGNVVTDAYGTVGGGANNRAGDADGTTTDAEFATIGGGGFNTAGGAAATIAGGVFNSASGMDGTIGGGYFNEAQGDFSTVAGGGPTDLVDPSNTNNRVYDDYGTISGGGGNRAGSDDADTTIQTYGTVGGGLQNAASGYAATIAGGAHNAVSDGWATIGGGEGNTASDEHATVGGGEVNTASGWKSTVGGGFRNEAQGELSTIAGGGPSNVGDATNTNNRVHDDYGTIGGGGGNRAGSDDADSTTQTYATVSGGEYNRAGDAYATVGGGQLNRANAKYATIAGGGDVPPPTTTAAAGQVAIPLAIAKGNVVYDDYGTIGGGGDNETSGTFATVGGGRDNKVAAGHGTISGGGADPNPRALCDGGPDKGQRCGLCSGGSGFCLYDAHCPPGETCNLNPAACDSPGTCVWYDPAVAVCEGGPSHGSSCGICDGGATCQHDLDCPGAETCSPDQTKCASPGTCMYVYTWGVGNRVWDVWGTVGGGEGNVAGGPWSTIGGGDHNTATENDTTVAGGWANTASYSEATVGGGNHNVASGYAATIAGGVDNNATGPWSTIGGGESNTASADYATVSGGIQNLAERTGSTVGGGGLHHITGEYGTVAGGEANHVWDDHGTVAGGMGNTAGSDDGDPTSSLYATVGGGNGNRAFGFGATVGGGETSVAFMPYGTVAGGRLNRANAVFATVAGGQGNAAMADNSTIGGGGSAMDAAALTCEGGSNPGAGCGGCSNDPQNHGCLYWLDCPDPQNETCIPTNSYCTGGGVCRTSGGGNVVWDDWGTIGGGAWNRAGEDDGDTTTAWFATVAGGKGNTASDKYATVGGGTENTASGKDSTVAGGYNNEANNLLSTVGGGADNVASGVVATVGGGEGNTASGDHATVPGGELNTASGNHSFAAGRKARARHDGSFVWADTSAQELFSSADNHWVVRASGGVQFWTNAAASTGSYLAAGSGTWVSNSDREVKENLASVNGREVLRKLGEIPVTTWNYKTQDPSIRHMGPMAQDLYAAFGLGDSEKGIATIDADGVALAAIQGLYDVVQEKECEIEALRFEKDAQIAELETRLAALEMLMKHANAGHKGGGR